MCIMMSFGLTKALAYYMDPMNMNFMEYLDKFVIVLLDVMFVYSKSEEEHLHLVSQKLQDPRLYVKISKCEFWMKQVSLLSYVILEEGIFVGSSTTRNVLSLDTPASVSNSQSFLGLVG
jgi:accessory gene regulator protein AgrB